MRKKIIISEEQLRLIETAEANKPVVDVKFDNPNTIAQNVKDGVKKARAAGATNNMAVTVTSNKNNVTDSNTPHFNINQGGKDAGSDFGTQAQETARELQTAGIDLDKVALDGTPEDAAGNGISESKTFTKKAIEKARLQEMRKTGITIRKRDILKDL